MSLSMSLSMFMSIFHVYVCVCVYGPGCCSHSLPCAPYEMISNSATFQQRGPHAN